MADSPSVIIARLEQNVAQLQQHVQAQISTLQTQLQQSQSQQLSPDDMARLEAVNAKIAALDPTNPTTLQDAQNGTAQDATTAPSDPTQVASNASVPQPPAQ